MKNNEINLFELDELPRYVEIAYKKLKNSIFLINPMLLPEMILLNLNMVISGSISSKI